MTADLPAPPAAAIGQAAPGMFAGVDMCLLCVLLVVCPRRGSPGCAFPGTAHVPIRICGSPGPAAPLCWGAMTGGGVVERYRRVVEPAVRGIAGVVVTVAFFATMTWRSQ